MRRFHQQIALAALKQGRFWPALGPRALGWRRFVRRLRRIGQDVAVLRLERRSPGAVRYYVWLTYRLRPVGSGRPAVVPHRIYLPEDVDPGTLRGTPPELRGLAFFAPGSGVMSGYTAGMTSKVGPKGQVVIPKELRDRLGITPGDLVTFSLEDRGVLVQPVGMATDLKGRFEGLPLVETLEDEHRRELSSSSATAWTHRRCCDGCRVRSPLLREWPRPSSSGPR